MIFSVRPAKVSLSEIHLILVVNHGYEPQGRPLTKISFQGKGYYTSAYTGYPYVLCTMDNSSNKFQRALLLKLGTH